QGSDKSFPVNAAVAGRAVIPTAAGVAGGKVGPQDAAAAVQQHDRILDMNMVDPFGKAAEEFTRVNSLPVQMARIQQKSEFLPATQGVRAISAVYRSNAICPGWTSQAKRTPHSRQTSKMGCHRWAKSLKPAASTGAVATG